MIGIQEIASYIPERRISNYNKKKKFDITDEFIREKIGVSSVSIKNCSENSSDLCIKAFENLEKKISIDRNDIDVLIVMTQNPDYNLPHTGAIVHGKLDFPESCASFDVALGCSGFVYGMSIMESFMKCNNFTKGLLFTADPYSKIIDPNDKNTSLLFGDASAVAYITNEPILVSKGYSFGTIGKSYKDLICEDNTLYMNGRAISAFAKRKIPITVHELLQKTGLELNDIDKYLFHQGSKYLVNSIASQLNLDDDKFVFDIYEYGNTVSSSIPILLEKQISKPHNKLLFASGFGVGTSWANVILERS